MRITENLNKFTVVIWLSLIGNMTATPVFSMDTEIVPYVTKKYGIKDNIYCQLEDPIENIACMAHDTALGNSRAGLISKQEVIIISAALEAASLIQTIASSARDSFYVRNFGKKFNTTSQSNLSLVQNRGICGNHQDLFKKALSYLNIPTRKISIYYKTSKNQRLNHAASEFLVNGKWYFIDITWNTVWIRDRQNLESILSYQELRSLNKSDRTKFELSNQTNIWFQLNMRHGLNAYSYLDAKKYFLEKIGDFGILKFDLSKKGENFSSIPNYIGSNAPGSEIKFIVKLSPENIGRYVFDVSGISCQEDQTIMQSSHGDSFHLSVGKNIVNLKERQLLKMKYDKDNICYVVFKEIRHLNNTDI